MENLNFSIVLSIWKSTRIPEINIYPDLGTLNASPDGERLQPTAPLGSEQRGRAQLGWTNQTPSSPGDQATGIACPLPPHVKCSSGQWWAYCLLLFAKPLTRRRGRESRGSSVQPFPGRRPGLSGREGAPYSHPGPTPDSYQGAQTRHTSPEQ